MNKINKFVVLDLSEDKNIVIENSIIYQLSSGTTETSNCKYLNKNFFSDKSFNKFQKNLSIEMLKFCSLLKKDNNDNFELLEIFNQRNDKTQLYNKIYFFIEIKKFILKNKFREIVIYTDDNFFIDIYKKSRIKNLKIINYTKKNTLSFFRRYIFSSLIFNIKTFILIFFMKFFRAKTLNRSEKNVCLSLYPNFYDKKKEIFFKKKFIKLNFQITDETHLNNSLFKNLRTFLRLNKSRDVIIVERFIDLKSIFFCFLNSMCNIKFIQVAKKHNFVIEGDNFSLPLRHLFLDSLINFNKLYIYRNALKFVLEKLKINNFHYYLFEYNFGYFLNFYIKKFSPKTKLIGYQHGIYSERLMWQNFTKLIKSKNYFPHEIILKHQVSKKSYLNNFNKVKLKFDKNNKNAKYNAQNKKNSNRILVFLGLHDCYDTINHLRNLNSKNFYSLKLHPKMKFKDILKVSDNFIFIDNIKNHKNNRVFLSPTSTMSYKFFEEKKRFEIVIPHNRVPLNPKIFDRYIMRDNKF